MKDKQEEDISWLFLWGAAILYTVVICMAFAGMVVTRPTVGTAFLEFTKNYSTLLAGIPVLIAVLVAKQQLDANRRQHVAAIKLQLKSEIDALSDIYGYAHEARNTDFAIAKKYAEQANMRGIYIALLSDDKLQSYSAILPSAIISQVSTMNNKLKQAMEISDAQPNIAAQYLREGSYCAEITIAEIQTELSRLSQYWS